MNSKIINLIVFSSVSYRISVAASWWTWIIFHAVAAIHSDFFLSVLFCLEWKVMLNFPNITSRTHKLCTIKCKLLRRDFHVFLPICNCGSTRKFCIFINCCHASLSLILFINNNFPKFTLITCRSDFKITMIIMTINFTCDFSLIVEWTICRWEKSLQ
jgi:hypothetical protein